MSLIRRALCAAGLLLSAAAQAQYIPNPIPGEPPIPAPLTQPPVETGTLTRDGGLVLPPGMGQAGGGPGVDLSTGFVGIPASAAYGVSDKLELGTGFTMMLTPFPWNTQLDNWLGGMFVSNLQLYGRYSITPKKLAVSAKLGVVGPLIAAGLGNRWLLTAEVPYTTELSDAVRMYWVSNLGLTSANGFQMQLASSTTFMFKLSDLFYAQGLLGTGAGFSGSGPVIPFLDYPVFVGTGGGMNTGENQGIGLALTLGIAQPVAVAGGAPTSPVPNVGIVGTYVKAI